MLAENPKAPATVILEQLRPLGYAGGITVLKERGMIPMLRLLPPRIEFRSESLDVVEAITKDDLSALPQHGSSVQQHDALRMPEPNA